MNDPQAVDGLLEGQPELLTSEEVAELLRVDGRTVLKWIREGGLRAISVGPRLKRIRQGDLRAFLLHADELHD